MKNMWLKIQKLTFIFVLLQFFFNMGFAQYKTYELTADRDTINAIDKKDLKQGRWVLHVGELRGEPGYEEEGIFKDGKKEGVWRRYNLNGDLIATENYRYGGKDGVQQYFTMMGDLGRIESWKAYNPDAPYDTIPVYGQGNNEIIDYKIVKAQQYSVKHGTWKFYDPNTGRLIRSETYDRGFLPKEPDANVAAADDKTKKVKPAEVLQYEKKNSGKKKVKTRDGATGY
ncbi:MAG: hypothetical protein JWO92_2200 [Chitinophagaceae bacterium]|nr:hypothetical protein [Chitinophagaceae bacterium]MDB5221457.1 hypothetical protein [Chitinophagaceae bacterium]